MRTTTVVRQPWSTATLASLVALAVAHQPVAEWAGAAEGQVAPGEQQGLVMAAEAACGAAPSEADTGADTGERCDATTAEPPIT
mmetsp:Transcript_46749/g.78481  ORF Transcript_46749/g.78481 Transcript_46749/m.78481 type:complete len:84 (+) Transcript_46749:101-352(+)